MQQEPEIIPIHKSTRFQRAQPIRIELDPDSQRGNRVSRYSGLVDPIIPTQESLHNSSLNSSGDSLRGHVSVPSTITDPPNGVVILKSDAFQGPPHTWFPYADTMGFFGAPLFPSYPNGRPNGRKETQNSRWKRRIWAAITGVLFAGLTSTIVYLATRKDDSDPTTPPGDPDDSTVPTTSRATTTRTAAATSRIPEPTSILQVNPAEGIFLKPILKIGENSYNFTAFKISPTQNITDGERTYGIALGRGLLTVERRPWKTGHFCKNPQAFFCQFDSDPSKMGFPIGNFSSIDIIEDFGRSFAPGLRMSFDGLALGDRRLKTFCNRKATVFVWCSNNTSPELVFINKTVSDEGTENCASHHRVELSHPAACPLR